MISESEIAKAEKNNKKAMDVIDTELKPNFKKYDLVKPKDKNWDKDF